MVRMILSFGLTVALVGVATAGKKPQTLGDKVLEYCQKNKGKQVGDGECAALASESLKAVGASGRKKDAPNAGDYVWGELVLAAEIRNGKYEVSGKLAEVKPGDIVQFRDTKWVTRSGNRTSTMTATHHTAVVAAVDKNRSLIQILHQNHGGKKIVQEGVLPLNDLKQGWIRVYRPVE